MTTAANFIDDFTHCLTSPDWLPFLSPPFKIISPPSGNSGVVRMLEEGQAVEFRLSSDTDIFGHLNVAPHSYAPGYEDPIPRGEDFFLINGINSGYVGTPQYKSPSGIGRELVRRSVRYAYRSGYGGVTTSIFTNSGSSFWYGLAFRSDQPSAPKWQCATDQNGEPKRWQARLAESPDQIWDLARTEFGRRVLFNTGRCGVLRFDDTKQRRYAFDRLGLAE